MPIGTGTTSTVRVRDSDYGYQPDLRERVEDLKWRDIWWFADYGLPLERFMAAQVKLMDNPLVLLVMPMTPWLPSVERRITDSIIPNEYGPPDSTEWIREEVGQ